jgi:tryptophan synthase beta chain
MADKSKKILLPERDMPTHWYNVAADFKNPPAPPLRPDTKQPPAPEDMAPIFPMGLLQQEMSTERWIEIPDEVRDVYKIYRPTPLVRADRLEKALDTPAKIYYKWEGVSPPGSHKPNTAIAQAYFNKQEGVKRLVTETGAGQWGSALAWACRTFGLGCTVYMVRISYEQKPYRRSLMHIWGAEVYPSPTDRTDAGRSVLAQNPDSPGSLGIAISEAVEEAVKDDTAKYSLGSVLNHVLLHQTIVGLETKKQMEMAGDYPDVVIGCVGGGSNFAGFCFPFAGDKLTGKKPNTRIIAVEPTSCPTLTKGEYRYDFGDNSGLTPLLLMYTLGHSFVPPPIHAGGLRYHGDAPLLCQLVHEGAMEAAAYPQNAVFEAALTFARTEGHVPAPETAHAIKCVVDEALKCKQSGESKVIIFNNSGHGHFDLAAYDRYLAKELEDYELPDAEIKRALAEVPTV